MKYYNFKIEISDEGKVMIDSDGTMDDILVCGFLELEKAKRMHNVLSRMQNEPTAEVIEDEVPTEVLQNE